MHTEIAEKLDNFIHVEDYLVVGVFGVDKGIVGAVHLGLGCNHDAEEQY
jgi:hypothetical protein